jgi:hypothetical protein
MEATADYWLSARAKKVSCPTRVHTAGDGHHPPLPEVTVSILYLYEACKVNPVSLPSGKEVVPRIGSCTSSSSN